MLDEEADEALVRAQWGSMNAERRLLGIVPVLVDESESLRNREVDLVGGEGKLAPGNAPDLNIDLRAVESRLVGNLDIVDARLAQHTPDHFLSSKP
jgi:hypothetical protein